MRFVLVFVMAVSSTGCLMETLTVTAIQGELAAQNASSATRVLSNAKDSKARTEIQSAIQAFQIDQERNPANLEELAPTYLSELPVQSNGQPWKYNAATGDLLGPQDTLPSGSFPQTMTAQDRRNVEAIRDAIYTYWESSGYYPRSLDDLEPLYMTKVPLTSSGTPFLYFPNTGGANHPAELMPATVQPGAGGGQRGTANDPSAISSQHTQRQLKVMNDLGL